MTKLFGGIFGRPEKQTIGSQTSIMIGGVEFDKEYVQYCIEQEQVVHALEANLHMSDDPNEIAMQTLKTACTFYGGDWAGILEVDIDLDVWTPVWWYNAGLKDRTTQLMHEFETAKVMPTWIKSMEQGKCIVIPDTSAVEELSPSEYAVYQRLRIHSVIASPFAPNPMGFLAIRNPSRHIEHTSMMNILAYVLHRAMAQQKALNRAKLTPSPESIQSDKDLVINFFGDMSICSCKGILKERDFNSPKCSRVITYLLLHPKAAHPAMEIYSTLWPDECVDPETAGRNIRGYIYRFRQAFSLICDYPLIESTTSGYRINPDLNLITDLQQFERLIELAKQTVSLSQKVDFMKKAHALYKGPLFKSVCDEHWIIGLVNHYRLCYVTLVNDLLATLASAKDYACVHHYAGEAINIMPGNLKAYYWVIVSMYYLGTVDLARKELERVKKILTREEYDILLEYLNKSKDVLTDELIL